MVTVDEQEVDRIALAFRGLVTERAQERRVPTGLSRDLSERDSSLEAHLEPAGWVRIDSGQRSVRVHDAPQERGVGTVHNADLDERASSLGVFCENSAFFLCRLSVSVS